MSLRLLIDECLSPDLVDLAVAAGHAQSTCLRDRGLLGTQDWRLIRNSPNFLTLSTKYLR